MQREAPGWYVHLLDNRDYQGCNGAVCYCDDRDACNSAPARLSLPATITILATTLWASRWWYYWS